MKSYNLLFAALLLLVAVSCKKSSPANIATVSNAEAANLATGALLYGSSGVGANFEDAMDVSQSLSLSISGSTSALVRSKINRNFSLKNSPKAITVLQCGTTYADTIVRQGEIGSADAFTYSTIYNFTLNCNNNTPDNVTANSTFKGNYIGIYALVTDTGSSNFTVSGLSSADTATVLSGTYVRHGSFTSTIDTSNHGIYNISVNINKVSRLKPTVHTTNDYFEGGTGTITIAGSVPKKGNFSYTGTLVFNGGDTFTVTLTLNGQVYTINLDTGVIVANG
jgi:hypothetical protein